MNNYSGSVTMRTGWCEFSFTVPMAAFTDEPATPFTNVKSGAWYYDAGRCKPEDNIIREEMAVTLRRWLDKDGEAAGQGCIPRASPTAPSRRRISLTRAKMIAVVARTLGYED